MLIIEMKPQTHTICLEEMNDKHAARVAVFMMKAFVI